MEKIFDILKFGSYKEDNRREVKYELPYGGARKMNLVNNVDSKKYLTELFNAMYS